MNDTIAAIATAYGEGGIGIVKISGEYSIEILSKVFRTKQMQVLKPITDRRFNYGVILDEENNEIIDECLAVLMKGPKSYTGEDVVEIHCHGSIVALRKTLNLVMRKGAVLADKGEFTKRAFLNGRMDLSEAEGVMDLIKAKTDRAYENAYLQMNGSLSCIIREIRKNLLDLLVNITVNLDYPDEDIEELTYENLLVELLKIQENISKLLDTSNSGKLISEGINTVIIGKPNVGKSSLMNALLKESRSIVTEIPGTTRDTIEEDIAIAGIPIKLIDTAGIRDTENKIERIGIERTKESFNLADLIIFILDGSKNFEEEDLQIMEKLENKKVIVFINKKDLGSVVKKEEIIKKLPKAEIINGAIIQNMGMKDLEACIEEMVYQGKIKQENSLVITNIRHENLLRESRNSLIDAINMTEKKEALDFIEVDVKRAWESLGEIIGEAVSEDIIDEVFARFCLGK